MRLIETQHLLMRLSSISEQHSFQLKGAQNAHDSNTTSFKSKIDQRSRRTNKLQQKVGANQKSTKQRQRSVEDSPAKKSARGSIRPILEHLGSYVDMKV